MPNRLADASSPYLLQHKENPVDWYPWGEEAFETAREEDKPIFLSIGYSTCHWCHVMEEESFENEEVASAMNDAFVSIKVDREERPDVDSLYMSVCQMMRGQGGWPLTILMTPDRRPFFAATYLPKHSRGNRMGMMDLVPRVQQLWEGEREKLLQDAEEVTDLLQRAVDESGGGDAPGPDVIDDAASQLARNYDRQHGGFGSQPKFPSPHNLLFLLRVAHATGDDGPLENVTHTLDRMRLGGIYDHVGYGFHRYSTDSHWLLPHFEKMLYDQATHVMAYTEAHQITGHDRYADTVREVVTYVERDLKSPEGGFYSAEDADSLTADGEREEGAFYVWSVDEIYDVLPEDLADLYVDVYNFERDGNYAEESTRQKTGKNIPHLTRSLADEADARGMDEAKLREKLDDARTTLFAARESRSRPGLDDKVLTDWNGLMIAALAKAGRVLGDDRFSELATGAAEFLNETMRQADGTLLHRYREGDAAIRGHLDDYAFLAWGLSELYETTFETRWLRGAVQLVESAMERFWDADRGGFYLASEASDDLIVRQKEVYDGAMPSGNSVMHLVLRRLGHATGRTEWIDRADDLAAWAGRQVASQPTGFTAFLLGTQFAIGEPTEVVLAGDEETPGMPALVEAVRSTYAPNAVVVQRPAGDAPEIAGLSPFTANQTPDDDRALAYVCRNFACDAPTSGAEALKAALQTGAAATS